MERGDHCSAFWSVSWSLPLHSLQYPRQVDPASCPCFLQTKPSFRCSFYGRSTHLEQKFVGGEPWHDSAVSTMTVLHLHLHRCSTSKPWKLCEAHGWSTDHDGESCYRLRDLRKDIAGERGKGRGGINVRNVNRTGRGGYNGRANATAANAIPVKDKEHGHVDSTQASVASNAFDLLLYSSRCSPIATVNAISARQLLLQVIP